MWMPRTVSMPASVRNPASRLARSFLESGFLSQKNTRRTTGANDAVLAGVEAAAREPVAVAPTARAVAAKMTSRRLRSVIDRGPSVDGLRAREYRTLTERHAGTPPARAGEAGSPGHNRRRARASPTARSPPPPIR